MAQAAPVGGMTLAQVTLLNSAQQADEKDQPGGYAGLNEDGNIDQPIMVRYETAATLAGIVLAEAELAVTSDTNEIRCGDGETNGGVSVGGGGGGSTLSRVFVSANGTAAENGTALVAAYTQAKALTPNGAAISATNPAYLVVGEGVFSLKEALLDLNLDTPYVHLIGAGTGRTRIVTDRSYQITIDQDNIHLKQFTIYNYQTGSGNVGAIIFNAGAGGSYSATNTGLVIEDVDIENTTNNNYTTAFNAAVTAFGGVYRRVRVIVGCNLFSAFNTASPTSSIALTVSATFEQCEIAGTQSTALTGGAFGGTPEGGANTAPNVFTGIIRRCIVAGTRIGILNRGLVEHSQVTCTRNSQPAIHAGTAGRFYFNRLRATGTGSPYSIGYYESATISAGHNMLGANGIDTGSGITNNLGTPYNVEDADWS